MRKNIPFYLRLLTSETESGGSAENAAADSPTASTQPTVEELIEERDKWKHFARQNEERAKANAEKAKRLDEIEEAAKTELEKALEAKHAAEERAHQAETAAMRSRIATKHGVPESALHGATEEEMEAQATSLLEWRGSQASTVKKSTPGAGIAGAQGSDISGASQLTQEQLKGMSAAEVNKARREGRLDDILGISKG